MRKQNIVQNVIVKVNQQSKRKKRKRRARTSHAIATRPKVYATYRSGYAVPVRYNPQSGTSFQEEVRNTERRMVEDYQSSAFMERRRRAEDRGTQMVATRPDTLRRAAEQSPPQRVKISAEREVMARAPPAGERPSPSDMTPSKGVLSKPVGYFNE